MKFAFCLLTVFVFLSSCEKECVSDKDTLTSECVIKCAQIPEVGPCNAAFPKYYYDTKTKNCDTFVWGGCNGLVPFNTLEDCTKCGCK